MTEQLRKLDENVAIPLKIVIPIVVATFACAVWVQTTLLEIKKLQEGAWTARHMQMWRDQLATDNPGVKVPGVPGVFGIIDRAK